MMNKQLNYKKNILQKKYSAKIYKIGSNSFKNSLRKLKLVNFNY
jgi:hypothetical protein